MEELLLASAGMLLGCQPRPGCSVLASCSGLFFLGSLSWWHVVCLVSVYQTRQYGSSAGIGSMQTRSTRQSLLLKWLALKEGKREMKRSCNVQRKPCLNPGLAPMFPDAGGSLSSALGAGSLVTLVGLCFLTQARVPLIVPGAIINTVVV